MTNLTANELPEFLATRFNTILFLLTNRCNLTCKHCYVSSSPSGEIGVNIEIAEALIDEAYDILGRITFCISGGEPLTRKRDTIRLLEKAACKHQPKLLTNGTLISNDISKALIQTKSIVRVSVDGGNPDDHDFIRGRGAFDKLRKGLGILLGMGYPSDQLEMYATVTPGRLDVIDDVIKFAEEFGFTKVKFEALAKGGRAVVYWPNIPLSTSDPENMPYRNFFEKEFHCRYGKKWKIRPLDVEDMGFTTLNVYADGGVFPYTYQDENDRKVGFLGNINSDPLREIISRNRTAPVIFKRFLTLANGPNRSLKAFWLTPNQEAALEG